MVLLLYLHVFLLKASHQLGAPFLVLAQVDKFILDISEGVEPPLDVLLRILKDLFEVPCPFGQSSQNRGMFGCKLLVGNFLLVEGLN